MRKLTIKEIAPYLPYGLKYATLSDDDGETYFVDKKHNTIGVGGNQSNVTNICLIEYSRPIYKIILRPLSDLTKEIDHNGEKFVPIDVIRSLSETPYSSSFRFENGNFIFTEEKLESNYGIVSWVEYDFYAGNQYDLFQKLLEWHFDVFSLIDQNLAIDINTLKE